MGTGLGMTAIELANDIALRLVGAFYALTAPIVLRTAATSRILTLALDALSAADPRESRAASIRTTYLAVNAVLIGAGGIFLMVRAALAAPVFAAAALSYGLYLFWFAPRYLDPWDPPEEPGRTQTRNALIVYLAATAAVLGSFLGGGLVPTDELAPAFAAVCLLLVALLAGYAVLLFKPWRPAAPRPSATQTALDDVFAVDDHRGSFGVSSHVVLTPSWNDGGLADAQTGDPCYLIEGVDLSTEEFGQIADWVALFQQLADRDDPLRCALRDPADQARIDEAGRPVHAMLVARAGAERVAYDPVARPRGPEVFPAAIKVMADHHCDPLWHDGGDEVGPIAPDQLGISWQLARDLDRWARDFDESIDRADPGGTPRWSPEGHAAHDESGRALAARLANELRRTGRADVPVRFHADPGPAAGV
jgi:hypothetical protein